jgi:hypothetical protein
MTGGVSPESAPLVLQPHAGASPAWQGKPDATTLVALVTKATSYKAQAATKQPLLRGAAADKG